MADPTEKGGVGTDPTPPEPSALGSTTPPEPPAEVEDRTYTAAEYKAIQDEAAQRRIKARETEEKNAKLAQRLVDTTIASTCKLLQDPDDLLVYVKLDDLLDDEGLPDEHKILQAEADLLERKPHLKSRRPAEPIEQGPRGDEGSSFSFSDWIKDAAG